MGTQRFFFMFAVLAAALSFAGCDRPEENLGAVVDGVKYIDAAGNVTDMADDSSTHKVYIFDKVGSYTLDISEEIDGADIYAIAGGGAGGLSGGNDGDYPGGGGAGGFLESNNIKLLAGIYDIVVGAGGDGSGANGGDTVLSLGSAEIVKAIGGGGGGGSTNNIGGKAGGSGGGGGQGNTKSVGSGGAGTAGQGYSGAYLQSRQC